MKFAIIADGGKQYRTEEGGTIEVDHVSAEVGDKVDLNRVLLVASDDKVTVGTPLIEGATVQATVVSQEKRPKVIVFKYRPKKRYRVKSGHRQKFTRLLINSIELKKPSKKGKEGKDGS